MKTVTNLQAYIEKCGLKDIKVDEKTIMVTGNDPVEIRELEGNKKGLSYYFTLETVCKFYHSESTQDGKHTIHQNKIGIFVTDGTRLVAFVIIYECENFFTKGNVISLTGHEETATLLLDNLTGSFVYYTR